MGFHLLLDYCRDLQKIKYGNIMCHNHQFKQWAGSMSFITYIIMKTILIVTLIEDLKTN